MKIENPHVIVDGPYALLVLTIDGQTHRLMAEQKPTLTRHGIVALPGYTAQPWRFLVAIAVNALPNVRCCLTGWV